MTWVENIVICFYPVSRRLLKTTPLWLIISCCGKIWADMLPNQEILNLVYLYLSDQESQLHKERTRRKTEKLHRRCLTGISNSLQSTYNEMERRDGVWWFYTMGLVESSKIKWLAQKSKITYNGPTIPILIQYNK